MMLAHTVAMKSKDQNTRCGCVLVGPNREIRSTGYNSFPRGIDDSRPERQQKPEKYFWFAHAERNAIYNAAYMGTSLKNCIMYVTAMPCSDCAIGIVQAGIKQVKIHDYQCDHVPSSLNACVNQQNTTAKTLNLLQEAGVQVEFWRGKLPPLTVLMGGNDVTHLVVEQKQTQTSQNTNQEKDITNKVNMVI